MPSSENNNSDTIEKIIDLYLLAEQDNALNLLRHLLFFPNPIYLDNFIAEYKGADKDRRSSMTPRMFWNAEDISCVAEYLQKKHKNRDPK